MNSIQDYWNRVKRYRAQVGVTAYLASQESPGSQTTAVRVIEAPNEIAARALAEGTHRLATEPEIAALKVDEAARDEIAKAAAVKSRSQYMVLVQDPALLEQARLAVTSPAEPAKPTKPETSSTKPKPDAPPQA